MAKNGDQHNWLLFGDFNMVLNSSEKEGGNSIDLNITSLFQNTINNWNLIDLGYYGQKYTWSNKKTTNSHIKERLDRFFVSSGWINKFPFYKNTHLTRFKSDHNPLLLEFFENTECREISKRRHTIRRFENLCLQDMECYHIVKTTWNNTSADSNSKLQEVLNNLYQWRKEKYGNLPKNIIQKKESLKQLQQGTPSKEDITRSNILEKELDDLLNREETWWAQRAKAHWLKHGDRNTRFFHIKANQKKKRNTIT